MDTLIIRHVVLLINAEKFIKRTAMRYHSNIILKSLAKNKTDMLHQNSEILIYNTQSELHEQEQTLLLV